MNATQNSTTNAGKVAQAASAWNTILAEVLCRGFHGTAALEIAVQDGTIQHIRRRVEQLQR